MTKGLVTALTFGFLAATLSVLPTSRAEAVCKDYVYVSTNICPQGWVRTNFQSDGAAGRNGPPYDYTCCTTPSEPYATGETDQEREARFLKEAAKIKADCEAQGKPYDPVNFRCQRPIKKMGKGVDAADCVAQGKQYDPGLGQLQAANQIDGRGFARRVRRH